MKLRELKEGTRFLGRFGEKNCKGCYQEKELVVREYSPSGKYVKIYIDSGMDTQEGISWWYRIDHIVIVEVLKTI